MRVLRFDLLVGLQRLVMFRTVADDGENYIHAAGGSRHDVSESLGIVSFAICDDQGQ